MSRVLLQRGMNAVFYVILALITLLFLGMENINQTDFKQLNEHLVRKELVQGLD